MITPVVSIVFDPQHRTTRGEPGSVNICIYYNKVRKFVSIGIMLRKREWLSGHVVRRGDATELNERIQLVYNYALNEVNRQIINNSFDIRTISTHLSAYIGTGRASNDFIKFCKDVAKKSNYSYGTIKQKYCLIRSLIKFGKIVSFSDLTPDNITKYDMFLKADGKRSQASVRVRHKDLHAYINKAIALGYLDNDPYRNISIPRGTSHMRRYLNKSERIKFMQVNPSSDYEQWAKDLFIVQMYTGLAYADLASVDFTCAESRGDKYVLLDQRVKTAEPYYIVLLEPVVDVLKRYDFKLPIISNIVYNRILKRLQTAAGITKNITTHTARHTFAVWALQNGTPIEIVQKMMGHSNIKTTQLYAIIVNSAIERAYDHLSSCI